MIILSKIHEFKIYKNANIIICIIYFLFYFFLLRYHIIFKYKNYFKNIKIIVKKYSLIKSWKDHQ